MGFVENLLKTLYILGVIVENFLAVENSVENFLAVENSVENSVNC
jgi:hypothetical protein